MITKTIMCPNCKTHLTIQGKPRETIVILCPNCNIKGKFTFKKTEIKTVSDYNIIEVKNLTKMFNGFKALDNISFNVKKGEILGFVGPNGAGKTTTIKLMTNLLTPTSGQIYINNIDVNKNPKKALLSVGSLIEVPGVYDYLTPYEMLKYFGKIHRMNKNEINQKIKEVLKIVKLSELEHKKIGSFSTGMQRRLAIAKAILHSPDILILDEPVIGLDPKGIKDVRDMLKQFRNKGVTIFLSSHLLNEVRETCDRIIFLDDGKIVTQGTIEEIMNRTKVDTIEVEFLDQLTESDIKKIESIPEINSFEKENGFLKIKFDGKPETSNIIITKLIAQGLKVVSFSTRKADLESFYVSIMNDEKGVM
ncbi:MAG: ABC transporter ATP-binding protein [Candidatus Thermoplasmatota archaeon]|jgi:ABC-2 type transport system ATP-binding protein|nr:ABC transporter ATP-binding protein [Candidatus Thermoplasmatota archaeon]